VEAELKADGKCKQEEDCDVKGGVAEGHGGGGVSIMNQLFIEMGSVWGRQGGGSG
jgi:hypothetical protein